ncbi:glucosaminidase domain-containing protein [uncultured Arcobacter sp.]|uniref:glucosaminidase domain-containing protein n=1 Tax=uncultured Arcobacter sp. TaxID=165434 RepID=UPI002603EFCB|nr:glucosaminidase domain-containing protein [uncultured Arcobacter sp.]
MKKVLSALFITFLFSYSFAQTTGFPEDYYKMRATIKKQNYFFDYLYPHIENANKNILKEREFILSLKDNKDLDEESQEFLKLTQIAKKYSVKDPLDFDKLLKKVNIVPPSMALAQAAVESGWGMSRFVKLGNNLFGHWTYGKKGIMPLRRDAKAKHLIRIFDSFEDSISAYMLNLNRTKAYYTFRNKRRELVKQKKKITGVPLSQTMINYSQIREKYLRILKNVIKKNKLQKYDEKFYNNLTKEKNEI